MSAYIVLHCDNCGDPSGSTGRTKTMIRANAKNEGWSYRRPPIGWMAANGGKHLQDLCPICLKEGYEHD